MKKIALWGLAALCLGFTACDDYETPNPPAQSNPADAVLSVKNLEYSETQAVFNLDELNSEGKLAYTANVLLTEALPQGYTLSNVMQVAASDSYAGAVEVATTTQHIEGLEYTVGVTPAAFQDAINTVVSKAPGTHTVFVRFAAYAVNGDSQVRFGTPDFYYGDYKLAVTALTPDYFISQAYYLIGTVSNEQIAKAVKFNHSSANVYDDTVFTLKVDITSDQANDGWKWMIISEEAYKAGNTNAAGSLFGMEVEDDDLTEGTLVANSASVTPYYGVVYEEGPHLIKFDAKSLEYSIALTIENLYTPGNAQGWSPATANMLYTENYSEYYGFAHLNGEFKFTAQPDWNPLNWGAGENPESDLAPGAGNLNAGADGLYWCYVNIANLTYKVTQITSCGVIGSLNSWGEQAPLTPSADFLIWTGTVNFDQGGEWKIRFNDNWDISLGGEMNNLTSFNGANLASPGQGAYKVTLDLSTLPYKVTVAK